jgi:hypothetical protein
LHIIVPLAFQGKTDRPSRLELGRQQQQQNDDGPGLLGPAPGGGFNPLLFLQNAHSRGPALSKCFSSVFMSAPFLEVVTKIPFNSGSDFFFSDFGCKKKFFIFDFSH